MAMKIWLDSNRKTYLQRHLHSIQHAFQYLHPRTINQKKIRNSFSDRYVEYKSRKDINDRIPWKMSRLCDVINDLKKFGGWKIQLTMKSKFMSLTDSNKKRTMYSKSDSSIVMIGNGTDEIIQWRFQSLLHK